VIDASASIFPNNVVDLVSIAFSGIDPDDEIGIFRRPLRNSDPQQSIGIHAQLWDPQDDSIEFMGQGTNLSPQRPTLQRYYYGAQAFVKDGDEERGLAVHATLSHRVRSVLYTHTPLKVALTGLKVMFEDGTEEVLQRWGISNARFYSGEIEGTNLYLSTLEFWVETETH
jgi:hypothetical protein